MLLYNIKKTRFYYNVLFVINKSLVFEKNKNYFTIFLNLLRLKRSYIYLLLNLGKKYPGFLIICNFLNEI
jgi:hypothetical protein